MPRPQRLDYGATPKQKLTGLTVSCLILNRTIGTGIFAQPSNVLFLTGSPLVSVILWIAGGLLVLCITLSWLELGLTIPRHPFHTRDGVRVIVSAPRSGGDKNYLEFIYKKPKLFMSCLFGITFYLYGNLAGNAIQFGIYMQTAISPTCTEDQDCFNKTAVILWAIFVISLCSLLNVATRTVFIGLNNTFAIAKCLLIVGTAALGIGYGATHGNEVASDNGCKNMAWKNRGPGGEFGDIVLAMFFAMFSYTGFEQPFYVLAEVQRPKKIFAKYVLIAMGIVIVLFPLTNAAFFCVVPFVPDRGTGAVPNNMALEFWDIIIRGGDKTADTSASQRASQSAVSAVLGVIIIGNIMAQTYTGTRVKQEIAKEGILPYSLAIATGSDSLYVRTRAAVACFKKYDGAFKVRLWAAIARFRRRDVAHPPGFDGDYIADHPEQVPMIATLLHTVIGIVLVIAVGSPTKPSTAYRILTYLRVFTIIVVLGLLTVAGLVFLRIDSWRHGVHAGGRRWLEIRQWPEKPWPWADWVNSLPAFVAALVLAFMSLAVFAKPSQIRPAELSIPYWVYPLAGWLSLGAGILWWAVLFWWRRKRWRGLSVDRLPHLVEDDFSQPVVAAELIKHTWVSYWDNEAAWTP